MFHCHICNIITWNTNKEEHLHGKRRPEADKHFTAYGSIEDEQEKVIMEYMNEEEVVELNGRTAEELILIKKVLEQIHM